MEHLGFLLKEKSCGYLSLRGCPVQVPTQNKSLLPLIGLQVEKVLKFLSVRSQDRDRLLTAVTDRMLNPASGHSVKSCLLCIGRRWHRQTVRTLRADTLPVKFLTLAQMCQPPSVSSCAHVLAYFHKHFQGC